MKLFNHFLALMILPSVIMTITGCTVDSPDLTAAVKPPPAIQPEPPPPPPRKPDPQVFEKNFYFSQSEATAKQERYDENIVTAMFRVEKNGESINNVKAGELTVTENKKPVQPFTLNADEQDNTQVAEILFLVDITGTMKEIIATAKDRLKAFIRSSRAAGYHTRMCFSTFGDYTVKHCERFYDNNPKDDSTEAQVQEMLTKLSQIQAYRGEGLDPGYPDLDENPMGALIDAANAPWGNDSLRFVILVTDWGFLHAPNNMGENKDPRKRVPTFAEVTAKIKEKKMNIFAVTRNGATSQKTGKQFTWSGYNTPFEGKPGIVQSSGGEHFDFDAVMRGEILLDKVLDNILKRIKTTYTLSYVVDQVPGLDPTLPQSHRKVAITLNDPNRGAATVTQISSTMPTGRPNYKKSWKISEQAIQPDSVKAYIDGREVNPADYQVKGGEIHFKNVPDAGSSMRFSFLYQNVGQNFRFEPLTFKGGLDGKNTKVYLNGKEAAKNDVILQLDTQGNTSLSLAESVTGSSDPYGIRKEQALRIRVVIE